MAMGVRVTPQQAADKWASRLAGSTAEITAGINRVQVAPGAQAAAKKDKWLQAVTAAQDKWARNTARVSLEAWKKAALELGVPRIGQGANQKKHKMADFMNDFIPHLERGIQQLANMPDMTIEQRVNKAVAMMMHNHNFKRSSTVS